MTTNSTSYLNRTQSSSTSDKIGTFSAWIKGAVPGETNSLFSGHTDSNNRIALYLSDRLQVYGAISGSQSVYLQTTAVFRDIAAWYHVVVAWDTTQGTSSNRFKIYVNGEQITAFDTASYPSQNADVYWNKGTTSIVGARYISSVVNYFYGYMSHVAFVDGQALAPTVFGETDSTSGIWKFKSPSGVTWGTNGFHLKFENSGNLGLDSSGNSNTFTVNGNGRQAVDTPSNVYATWNPLEPELSYKGTYSNGNTTVATTVTGGTSLRGSIAIPYTGKWYWENKVVSTSGTIADNSRIGIATGDSVTVGSNVRYMSNGQKTVDASASSYGATYGAGDIIGVAVDSDNNTVEFFKNGASQGSISYTMDSSLTYKPYISENSNSISITFSTNFGNGYFGTTAITSAGSNGNGSLFEYDVPSGYYALNTKNINTYG